MVLGPHHDVQIRAWNVDKSKPTKKKDNNQAKVKGCWIKFRFMGNCLFADSKSKKATTTQDGRESNSTRRSQPVVPVVSTSTTNTSTITSTSSTSNIGDELKIASQLRKFTFNELRLVTRHFSAESLLGEGGFGCVYKGWISENGTSPAKPGAGLAVAVKTLNPEGLQGHKEWLHCHFLGPQAITIPVNKLVGSMPLPWSTRMKIAIGAAKGVAFLHTEAEKPVIYRDFKTSNILLDVDYNAKLSDFGLAKDGPEGDKTHVSTRVMGTYGYAAPEYVMTGHLTSRSDVYSFGVVLLELLTGRRAMDKKRPIGEHNLVEWARPHLGDKYRFYQIMDPRLDGRFSIKGARIAMQLAAQCLCRDPKARPLMSEIVEILKPLPNLKDMASSSSQFQTMQGEGSGSRPNARFGGRVQTGFVQRNSQPTRSISIPSGLHTSPYHHGQPLRSPKPNVGRP
ncbi:hypothetical protein ACFE04_007268 [Oxalis oulophora]